MLAAHQVLGVRKKQKMDRTVVIVVAESIEIGAAAKFGQSGRALLKVVARMVKSLWSVAAAVVMPLPEAVVKKGGYDVLVFQPPTVGVAV